MLMVFDGKQSHPYIKDALSPLSIYGNAKAVSERVVLNQLPGALIIRTAAFFGPEDSANLLINVLQKIAAGEPCFRTS